MLQADRQGRAIEGDSAGPKLTKRGEDNVLQADAWTHSWASLDGCRGSVGGLQRRRRVSCLFNRSCELCSAPSPIEFRAGSAQIIEDSVGLVV
jgi:hypothetical protein